MFLPLGDNPNSEQTPYVTYILIATNVLIFLLIALPLTQAKPELSDPALKEYIDILGIPGNAHLQAVLSQLSAYDLFIFRFGFRPAEASLLDLFTSMFLHAGWMHLAGNMLFLWIFGDNVEHRLGHINFFFGYIGTGLIATLFFSMFASKTQIPLVGASGAISGVLGSYFIWFPRNKVKVFIFLFPIIMTTMMIPARVVLGFYLVLDNLLPFILKGSSGSGVAHGAHIGGFLAGMFLAYVLDRFPAVIKRQKVRTALHDPAINLKAKKQAETVTKRLYEDDIAGGIVYYESLNGKNDRLKVPDAQVIQIGNTLYNMEEYDRSLSVFRKFIRERPNSQFIDRAYLGAGKAMIHKHGGNVSAYQYFLQALDTASSKNVKENAQIYIRAIEKVKKTHG